MLAMRQILPGPRGGTPLPYDAEVEYLEFSPAQYIELLSFTGAETKVRYYVDVMPLNIGQAGIPGYIIELVKNFGAPNIVIYGNRFNYQCDWNSTSAAPVKYSPLGVRSILDVTYVSPNTIIVTDNKNESATITRNFYANSSIRLNGRAERYSTESKFYGLKIWIDDVLIIDFVPVRFTNELGVSEGAMYDRVSGQLFRNAGTGAFTIGPDKS